VVSKTGESRNSHLTVLFYFLQRWLIRKDAATLPSKQGTRQLPTVWQCIIPARKYIPFLARSPNLARFRRQQQQNNDSGWAKVPCTNLTPSSKPDFVMRLPQNCGQSSTPQMGFALTFGYWNSPCRSHRPTNQIPSCAGAPSFPKIEDRWRGQPTRYGEDSRLGNLQNDVFSLNAMPCVNGVGGCAKARKYGGKNATSTPWGAAPDPALPWAAAKGKAQNHPSAAAMHNFKKSQVRAARKARFPAAIHKRRSKIA
jgi:hypothetical protein